MSRSTISSTNVAVAQDTAMACSSEVGRAVGITIGVIACFIATIVIVSLVAICYCKRRVLS